MLHKDSTLNHKIENWTFADAAARAALSTSVPDDIGKLGYQTDTGAYYRLLDNSPLTWSDPIGATGGGGGTASGFAFPFVFGTGTTDVDPTVGKFTLNSGGTWGTAAIMRIHYGIGDDDNTDLENFIRFQESNAFFIIRMVEDPNAFAIAVIDGTPPTDHTGTWATISFTRIAATTGFVLAADDEVTIEFGGTSA